MNWKETGRRPFLKGGGLALLTAFMPATAAAQNGALAPLSAEEAANVRLVNDFCTAWSSLDLERVTALMTEDCIYRMTEETPPVTGHQGLINQMQPWVDSSDAIEFRVLETYARGPLVINHRVDIFQSATRPLTWEGVGVFLISEGRIREWFDYSIRVVNRV